MITRQAPTAAAPQQQRWVNDAQRDTLRAVAQRANDARLKLSPAEKALTGLRNPSDLLAAKAAEINKLSREDRAAIIAQIRT